MCTSISSGNHENGLFESSFDDPRKMHLLNFIKGGNKYYDTSYGKRWAVMELICRIFVSACARIIMKKYKSKLIDLILVLVQKQQKSKKYL